jgi:peptidoglycan/xylan/chitin deacetylase (PgdA/CDA1 family)
MSWLVPRSLFVVLAFGAGTYVGMHGLKVPEPVKERIDRAAHDVEKTVNVDGDQLPDPLPWPRLNPACTVHRAWLLAEGPADPSRKLVTFTFDDGPTTDVTPAVLDTLERHHATATFFFVGASFRGKPEHVKAARAVAERVVGRGHLVGSHTQSHALLTQIDRAKVLSEIDDGIDTIAKITRSRPVLFRPPYGQLDSFGEEAIRARGLELIMWSIEADAKTDPDAMFASLRDQIAYAGGGIVLMHDTRAATPVALGKLLDWLARKRFEVVDLPTYLRETAAHPQPYPDRTSLERARAAAWRSAHPVTPKLDEGA